MKSLISGPFYKTLSLTLLLCNFNLQAQDPPAVETVLVPEVPPYIAPVVEHHKASLPDLNLNSKIFTALQACQKNWSGEFVVNGRIGQSQLVNNDPSLVSLSDVEVVLKNGNEIVDVALTSKVGRAKGSFAFYIPCRLVNTRMTIEVYGLTQTERIKYSLVSDQLILNLNIVPRYFVNNLQN